MLLKSLLFLEEFFLSAHLTPFPLVSLIQSVHLSVSLSLPLSRSYTSASEAAPSVALKEDVSFPPEEIPPRPREGDERAF